MVIEGDPFRAWDDLAAQVRDGEIGLPMPGSADSCTWLHAQEAPTNGEGLIETPDDPSWLEALEVRAEEPDPTVVGLECIAGVSVPGTSASQQYGMSLRGDDRSPMTLTFGRSWVPLGPDIPAATAWMTTYRNQAGASDGSSPGPDPVPAGSAAFVPDTADQPSVESEELFGQEVNCFAHGGPQTRLPPGSTLVADGFGGRGTSVIAVEDAGQALADLTAQFADPSDELSEGESGAWDLDDGRTAEWISHSVSAGGGWCGALASPDGRFVRIDRHGD